PQLVEGQESNQPATSAAQAERRAPRGVPGGRPPGQAPRGVPGGRPPGQAPRGVPGGRPPGSDPRGGQGGPPGQAPRGVPGGRPPESTQPPSRPGASSPRLVSRPLINPRLTADPRLRIWLARIAIALVLYIGFMLSLGWRYAL